MNAMAKQTNIIPMAPAVPMNPQAEKGAMAAILNNLANLDAMNWSEDLFFNEAHRIILESAKRVKAAGGKTTFDIEVDLVSRGLLDQVGGGQGLWEISNHNLDGSQGNAAYHRKYLVEAARYRRALEAVRQAERDFLRQEGDIAGVSLALADAAAQGESMRESTKDLLDGLVADMEKNEPVEAFGSGLGQLDDVTTGGVKRGELLVIAAETSGGKSILLLQLALEALRAGKKVAVFSLEMPGKQVVGRMLSSICGFNIGVIKYLEGKPTNDTMRKFEAAVGEMSQWELQVESGTAEMEEIDGAVRELVAKGKADLVIVDYIQLVHLRSLGSNETREQHVSEIAKRLKNLALQLNIAVATASQLNDDGKLRESRAIGHHSDHVWMISHGKEGSWLLVDKNRGGERNVSLPILMHGATSQFVPRDERETQTTNKK